MDEASTEYGKIMSYIDNHPAAVVGYVDSDGSPRSAVVYICTGSHHTVFFLTRNLTDKYKSMYDNKNVSITIFDEHNSSTLQASGEAFISNDDHIMNFVYDKVDKINAARADSAAPIKKLKDAGDYVVIGIELKQARLAEYGGVGAFSTPTFTEISA